MGSAWKTRFSSTAALTARHYEPDAFHLNSEGAALFTAAIARISGARVVSNGTVFSTWCSVERHIGAVHAVSVFTASDENV